MRGLDFFENLLPEGPTLTQMARLAGVPAADTYGILTAFGRDCAGAIVLLPEGERPHEDDADTGYLPVSASDLGQIIGDLASIPLAAAPELGFRPSLAGTPWRPTRRPVFSSRQRAASMYRRAN